MPMRILVLLLFVAGWPHLSSAQEASKPASASPKADPFMTSAIFLSGHPDLRYRMLGLDEYRKGNLADAFRFFQRGAYYADKPSQGMVAEMLWTGQGVAQDRALAYAWMDLAAERGYLTFLGARERYWTALNEADRTRAIEEGQTVYSLYGDAAAMPRIATALRRARAQTTGSRTGFAGSLQIFVPGPGGFEQIDGSKFYDPKYWDPEKYRAWHDSIWLKPRLGHVSVGEVEAIRDDHPLVVPSRVPASAPLSDTDEPQTPARDETGLGNQPTP